MHARTCLAIAVLLLFAAPVMPSMQGSGTEPAPAAWGYWIIDSRIVFESRIVNVTNNIYIKNGGILVFNNTQCLIGDQEAPGRRYEFVVEQGGALEILGSQFDPGQVDSTYDIKVLGRLAIINSTLFRGWCIRQTLPGPKLPEQEQVVLEGSTFGLTGRSPAIRLNWTRARINDCVFHNNSRTCLEASNSTLNMAGCTFSDNQQSMVINDIRGLVVSDSRFDYNDNGIFGTRLSHCNFKNLGIEVQSNWGVHLTDSDNISITGSDINACNDDGVFLYNCTRTVIEDSVIGFCSGDGISSFYSQNLTVRRTNLTRNNEGISVYAVEDIRVLDCDVYDNDIRGINMEYSWDSVIASTRFTKNSEGMQVLGSTRLSISDCSVQHSGGRGLDALYCSGLDLRDCIFANSNYYDVSLEECTDSTISGIDIVTEDTGLHIFRSENIECFDIDVTGGYDASFSYYSYGSDTGLEFEDVENLEVSRITLRNLKYAAVLQGCLECRFLDITTEGSLNGLSLMNSDYNELTDLDIGFLGNNASGDNYGISLQESDYNLVNDFKIYCPGNPTKLGSATVSTGIFIYGYYNMFINGTVGNAYYGISTSKTTHSSEIYDVNVDSCLYGSWDRGKKNQYRHCVFSGNFYGALMSSAGEKESEMNRMEDCTFDLNYIGLKTDDEGTNWVELTDCRFEDNMFGLILWQVQFGYVEECTFMDNGYGIYIDFSDRRYFDSEREVEYPGTDWDIYPKPVRFYFSDPEEAWYFPKMDIKNNNFIRNQHHNNLYDDLEDWNECSRNFFSDYSGRDTNRDGIGDTRLPWARCDHYPRMLPYDIDDSDGDGFNDLTEELVGTDPANASSVPRDDDGDGVPDGLRQGGGSQTDDDVDDDGEDDDVDDSAGDTMLPAAFRLMIVLISAGFLLLVVFVYYRNHMDRKGPKKPVRKGGPSRRRRKK